MAEGRRYINPQTPVKDNEDSLLIKHKGVHTKFLKNKFIQDLADAQEEHTGENSQIPLLSQFLKIRDVLEGMDITSSTPTICSKNCLYNAISALDDCMVLLEKREPRKKDGPMKGYTLAELWLICKTRRLLLQIKRKLTAKADQKGVARPSSSSTIQPYNLDIHTSEWYSFEEQRTRIFGELHNRGKGFHEIVILGIGGSGKTALAKMISRIRYWDTIIWICLFDKLSGDIELKEMIKEMLKQSEVEAAAAMVVDGGDFDFGEDELLEMLGTALKGKKYLIVLDGIWDISIDWYFKLKQKLSSVSGDGDGHVIITTRLPYKARMMVGPHCRNLYHIQPPSPMEFTWQFRYRSSFRVLERYRPKLKDEIVERFFTLPLAYHALAAALEDRIGGVGDFPLGNECMIVLINCEDDATLGNDLLLSCGSFLLSTDIVINVSKLLLHDIFNQVNASIRLMQSGKMPIVVWSGNEMANQLMQVIMQVVKNLKHNSNPPFLLLPLGFEASTSYTLGWENHLSGTLPKNVSHFLDEVWKSKTEKEIDSWEIITNIKSMPKDLRLPSTFGLESAPESKLQPMEGDEEFHVTFWNYFSIGLDAEEYSQRKDEYSGGFCCKPWLRDGSLLICIKTKDQRGEWKEINIPHSTRSIVCFNLSRVRDRSDVKKKYWHFKYPSLNDGLLEIICFKDALPHGDDFLPSKFGGKLIAQVATIRFEIYNTAISHFHMSIDGNRWKHSLPIEDKKVIEIYHSGKTKVYMNPNSKCKFNEDLRNFFL